MSFSFRGSSPSGCKFQPSFVSSFLASFRPLPVCLELTSSEYIIVTIRLTSSQYSISFFSSSPPIAISVGISRNYFSFFSFVLLLDHEDIPCSLINLIFCAAEVLGTFLKALRYSFYSKFQSLQHSVSCPLGPFLCFPSIRYHKTLTRLERPCLMLTTCGHWF